MVVPILQLLSMGLRISINHRLLPLCILFYYLYVLSVSTSHENNILTKPMQKYLLIDWTLALGLQVGLGLNESGWSIKVYFKEKFYLFLLFILTLSSYSSQDDMCNPLILFSYSLLILTLVLIL